MSETCASPPWVGVKGSSLPAIVSKLRVLERGGSTYARLDRLSWPEARERGDPASRDAQDSGGTLSSWDCKALGRQLLEQLAVHQMDLAKIGLHWISCNSRSM